MQILKKHSTKPERQLADVLIKNRIPFKFREIIESREIDFVIGRVVVEVDGIHHQRRRASERFKNEMLARLGYLPLHFSAKEVKNNVQQVLREIKRSLKSVGS